MFRIICSIVLFLSFHIVVHCGNEDQNEISSFLEAVLKLTGKDAPKYKEDILIKMKQPEKKSEIKKKYIYPYEKITDFIFSPKAVSSGISRDFIYLGHFSDLYLEYFQTYSMEKGSVTALGLSYLLNNKIVKLKLLIAEELANKRNIRTMKLLGALATAYNNENCFQKMREEALSLWPESFFMIYFNLLYGYCNTREMENTKKELLDYTEKHIEILSYLKEKELISFCDLYLTHSIHPEPETEINTSLEAFYRTDIYKILARKLNKYNVQILFYLKGKQTMMRTNLFKPQNQSERMQITIKYIDYKTNNITDRMNGERGENHSRSKITSVRRSCVSANSII